MEVLDNSAIQHEQLHTFLQAASLAAYIQITLGPIWKQTEKIVALPPNTLYVQLKQDKSHLVGMPFVENRIISMSSHIYIDIHSESNIYKSGWLMVFVFDHETKQLFYWNTEMVTVYERGTDHDFTQAGQLGRIGFSNASGGGGVGVTSTSN